MPAAKTKDLSPPPPPPRAPVVWKAVNPKHYGFAQELKKQGGAAYEDYVLALVESYAGRAMPVLLGPKQVDQIIATFEAEFGGTA